MFIGFNTHIDNPDSFLSGFTEIGEKYYKDQKKLITMKLGYRSIQGEELSASKIEDDWFPSIDANVFISHSHKDEKLAIGLAGFLKKVFGLDSFIDSCVWGYADDLLKMIDEKYCVSRKKNDGSVETYDYKKRNQSTSHVHMILNAALHKMIDKTECLMFLNTPNSLTPDSVINDSMTASPWIYSELVFSRLCRKRLLGEYRPVLRHDDIHVYSGKELKIKYDVELSDLINIDENHLYYVWKTWSQRMPTDALDCLYDHVGAFNH